MAKIPFNIFLLYVNFNKSTIRFHSLLYSIQNNVTLQAIKIMLKVYHYIDYSLFLRNTSTGYTCKARAASSSEKINIDFVCEIVNFGSLNLIILKKKSKNTIKYHNIFTISSFLGSE